MEESNEIANEHGFWDGWSDALENDERYNNAITTKIMLIVTELSEAVEHLRGGKNQDEFTEEIADAIIRIVDLSAQLNLPLVEAIEKKMEKNRSRPYKHGKSF